MRVEDLDIGDIVYAAATITDDGSIPVGLKVTFWQRQGRGALSS
jgi:hypothetical protein